MYHSVDCVIFRKIITIEIMCMVTSKEGGPYLGTSCCKDIIHYNHQWFFQNQIQKTNIMQ